MAATSRDVEFVRAALDAAAEGEGLASPNPLDGRIATHPGASQSITGREAREASQELRRRYDAILVGVNTAIVDDPELTYRGGAPKRAPLVRAVVDPRVRLPLGSRLVATAAR